MTTKPKMDIQIIRKDENSLPNTAKKRAAVVSIIVTSSLVCAKLIVGLISGSVSVLSEAIHSTTDLAAACIAFFSVRASDTPPDAEHPYGHGKIESISGLAEALLIFVAAAYIIYQAVSKLRQPTLLPVRVDVAVIVMGISAIATYFLSRFLSKAAKDTDSLALKADAQHTLTDVFTSVGVFAGLLLTHLTHLAWLDPVVGFIVALWIMGTAYRLALTTFQPLIDARLPPEEESKIREVLLNEKRVLGFHKLRTRKSGSQRHADVHVQINDNCSLVDAHNYTEELEDKIRGVLPAVLINIHIEPYYAEMQHQQEAHGLAESDLDQKSGNIASKTKAEGK